MYRPRISYRYVVNGEEFVSTRTQFGDWIKLSWSGPARRTVQKYPAGSRVVVSYAPDEPEEAVLESGIHTTLLHALVFAGFFLAIGILAWRQFS